MSRQAGTILLPDGRVLSLDAYVETRRRLRPDLSSETAA
jgi:hypothetical protein